MSMSSFPGLVVERGPQRVAFARRDRTRLDSVTQLGGGVEQCTDLLKTIDREVAAVDAGEGPEQGKPLEAEQVCERVLVEHTIHFRPPQTQGNAATQRRTPERGRLRSEAAYIGGQC
jgi:hypothetical protein